MGFKKTKLAIASTLIIALGACAQKNVNDLGNGPRNVNNPGNVSTGELNGPTNVSTGDLKRPINNLNVSYPNSTTEIQPMNNGFITIDQNSYSTSMASHQFPHSKRVQQGNFWYYSFQPEMVTPRTAIPKQPKQNIITQPPSQNQVTRTPAQPSTQPTTGINKMALQVIDLTNAERKKHGLPALKADATLSKVAQAKSYDMETKHYFSHTSPTYGSPFDMMRDFGVTYRAAGENIAMGQPTAEEVVNAWMNSEGHRKNILSPNYTNIGVGFTQTGNYWSQMFIGK